MLEKLNLKPTTELKIRLVMNVMSYPPFSLKQNRFKLIHNSFKEIDRMFNKFKM